MQTIKRSLWGLFAVLTLLWLVAEPRVFQSAGFFALRSMMMQWTGIIAIGAMSVAMILALRPQWPERWFGGLDKMYRLHKWLGIAALIVAVTHWLWAEGPKWAVGLGLLERPMRGPRGAVDNPIHAVFMSMRGAAEGLGEWAFYASVILIALALIKYIPYRFFFKTHRLLALAYLVLTFHSVVLLKFSYWMQPVGWVTALLLACGTWAAIIVLLRRVGTDRQVQGRIATLQYYPGVRALETEIDVPHGWPGHKPGQFAFVTSDASEGAHPYTIASSWHDQQRRITFITKELGDHTSRLREKLKVGQEIKIEGPYGCFTFDDDRPHQIWIGGGVGITPFIARMKEMARQRGEAPDLLEGQMVDLYHCSADADELAFAKLAADAKSAHVHLHLMIDARDGFLRGERIRADVAQWREAGIWFCGPAGLGEALRRDFAAHGFPVAERFHQELFAMR